MVSQYGIIPGESVLQGGVGVGRMYGEMFEDEELPYFNLSYEYALDEYFSMGGVVAYGVSDNWYSQSLTANERYYDQPIRGSYDATTTYQYWIISGKISFHIYADEVLDIFVTGYAGYDATDGSLDEYIWWQYSGYYTPAGSYQKYVENRSVLFLGATAGAKIYFTEQLGFFLEGGYGIGYINGGLTFRFW